MMKSFSPALLFIALLFAFAPSNLYAGPCDSAQDGGPQAGPYTAGHGPGAGTSSDAGEWTSINTEMMLKKPWQSVVDVTCAGFAMLATLTARNKTDETDAERQHREARERFQEAKRLQGEKNWRYRRSTSGGANVNGPQTGGAAVNENRYTAKTFMKVAAEAAEELQFDSEHNTGSVKRFREMLDSCKLMGKNFCKLKQALGKGGNGKLLASDLATAIGG